jgi:ABC-type sugar transport system substrate-binding protein/AraC-like DNA-binding protein
MLVSEDRLLIFWNSRRKEVPPRPRKPEQFPEWDARHWYDREYAGWGIRKEGIPESPGDGPAGKRVVLLQAGFHPYHVAYTEGLTRAAERFGVNLITLPGNMTEGAQDHQVHRAVEENPDLAILVPISTEACSRWVTELHDRGIPVIVSNFFPSEDSYRSILSWCGPDDWGQFRMLARKFAGLTGRDGGYAIVRHLPGTSCWDSRTWAVITELRTVAPRMRCLAMAPASREGSFDPAIARELVDGWLREFGRDLRGIVLPDDDIVVDGVNEALAAAGREDVIRVGAGSTQKGMQLIREGRLHAITFQPAQADGALALKVAVDWLAGLDIEPINYLPKHVITREDVEDFIAKKPEFSPVGMDALTRAILAGSATEVERFFESAYQSFLSAELLTPEFFHGFSIEVISTLIHLLRMNDVPEESLLSDYETMYKNLFNQKTPRRAMEWMMRSSKAVLDALARGRGEESLIDRIVRYVTRNYAEKLSLKTLAVQFGISAPYLGRLFRHAVGKPFATYLNELRLQRAEELLRYSSMKASDIASRIGYSNPNYFYTLYKKYKGRYPSESKQGS